MRETLNASLHRLALLPCVGLLLIHPALCGAQVFRWTDSEGRVQYGDRPPDAQSAKSIAAPSNEPSALADVKVEETSIEWFDLRGFSSEEIRASMRETAPYSEVRKSRVWGQCRWWFEWDFKHRVEPSSCRIDKFSIRLRSEMRLPRWLDASRAPSDLKQRWDDFERGLRRHENGHKANGVNAANDLARRLRSLPEFTNCNALNEEIKKTRDRVRAEYNMLDDAFDRVDLLYLKGFQ
jgi:predicted secreted Zn-dependent protease